MPKILIVGLIVGCVMIGLIAPVAAANPKTNPGTHPHQDGGGLPLDATYTAEDGTFTIAYPGAWIVNSGGWKQISINDPDLQIAIIVRWGTPQEIVESDLTDSLDLLMGFFNTTGNVMPQLPYEETLGNETIAIADGTLMGEGKFYAAFPATDGVFGLMNTTVYSGELADYSPTLMAMIASALPGAAQADTQQDTSPTEGALPLTETYTLKNDYSFNYPQGWATEYELNEPDLSLLILASSDPVAETGGFFYDFQPGDVWVDFRWEALGNFSGVDATSSPVDVLNASIIGMYPDMADAYEIQLGDHTFAIAEGVDSSGLPMLSVFAFWDEDTIFWYLALMAPGEYEQNKPTFLAIAESAMPGTGQPIESSPEGDPSAFLGPLTETYTLKNGYTVSYPGSWIATDEFDDGAYSTLVLGTNETVTEGRFGQAIPAGHVRVDIAWDLISEQAPDLPPDASLVDVLEASLGDIFPGMGEPYEMPLGSATVAVMEGTDLAENAALIVAFRWSGDIVGVMLATTDPGDYEVFKPTLLEIAESAMPGGSLGAITVPDTVVEPTPTTAPSLGQGPLAGAAPDAASGQINGPTSINGPEDCYNVAVSIGDYSSQYGEGYSPVYLLDGDPATGWSSSNEVMVQFVEINLDGLQTVYGVLFNSYSTSSGWETDSINEFAIEATLPDGSARAVFKGQAALEEGYQSYLFDPVETDQLRFIFSSTHGGSYYEAADIMVCALEGASADGPSLGMPLLTGPPEIRQWASHATATTQYTDTGWSALQATGAPDTEVCGDIETAWASRTADGVDVLTVYFDTPVIPKRIHIFQTYNPGAITSVELVFGINDPVLSIPNSADNITGCPGAFTVDVPEGFTDGRPVIGVMIRLDQRDHPGWNEIDAVELVGTAP